MVFFVVDKDFLDTAFSYIRNTPLIAVPSLIKKMIASRAPNILTLNVGRIDSFKNFNPNKRSPASFYLLYPP